MNPISVSLSVIQIEFHFSCHINSSRFLSEIKKKKIIKLPAPILKGPFRGMDTLSRKITLSKLFCLPSEMGSTLKGKNLEQSLFF